jgi:hypothetical protein
MVRDEEAIIGRWVAATAPHVDGVMLLDTGSTDNTLDIFRMAVQKYAPHCRYAIESADWVNFSHNRNVLRDTAHGFFGRGDNVWHLNLDADHEPEFVNGWREWLTPGYHDVLTLRHAGPLRYYVPRLYRGDVNYTWHGVTHEYTVSDARSACQFTGIVINDHADGSSRTVKFCRDIDLLTEFLKSDPVDARSWFYLGQSYRDLGDDAHARHAYGRSAACSSWSEERFYASYQAACCTLRLGDGNPPLELLRVYASRPTRIEPLVTLADWYIEVGTPSSACTLLNPHANDPIPNDFLFVETDKWSRRDEILKGKGMK